MKILESIDRYARIMDDPKTGVSFSDYSDGLKHLFTAITPLRKEEETCIGEYIKVRDRLPLTQLLADKKSYFAPDLEVGKRWVDKAVLQVIYEDRYSFGYLYWYLVSELEHNGEDVAELKDNEAPYKRGLIEYAIDFDLEETLKKAEGLNLEEKEEYAWERYKKSRQQVLIEHHIKDEYELALETVMTDCGKKPTVLAPLSEDLKAIDSSDISNPRGDRKSPEESPFAINNVINSEKREQVMAYLHGNIEGKTGRTALNYLQAAIKAGYIKRPTFLETKREFGKLCEKSNYYSYVQPVGKVIYNEDTKLLQGLVEEMKKRVK